MKKYLWGIYEYKQYSLLEFTESPIQVVVRFIGTKTHVTLHKLSVSGEIGDFYNINYQGLDLKIPKSTHSLISYNWSSPAIGGVWSEARKEIAETLGFKDPEKHAISSQGILTKLTNSFGYNIGACAIVLNNSSSKRKYLSIKNKIGEIKIPSNKFMIKLVLSTNENPYKGKAEFIVNTKLGNLIILVDRNLPTTI